MRPDWPVVVRQVIAATNCTAEQLAEHIGCHKNCIDQWQRGEKRPCFENGWELLNAYVANVSRKIPQRVGA